AFVMLKNQKRNQGFTIIEVLIVLAIAGLILLIVFLAVPALQRNSRNTQYKNDAAALIGAATEFSNNSNGAVPKDANETTVKDLAKTRSLTNLDIETGPAAVTLSTFDEAIIRTASRCPATPSGDETATLQSGSTRSMVIVYPVENSAGKIVAQCTES
ncbi:MAG TPA: type II secretion system protein, partial [Candidatus Limnocylindrales bacterium]|nr:type II secretion system protein [Candidatus Limnocylindrales bacterium]